MLRTELFPAADIGVMVEIMNNNFSQRVDKSHPPRFKR